MRQPTIHQMREKKKSSRKSQGSRKVTILGRSGVPPGGQKFSGLVAGSER
jgi:hypothetical protein